MVDRSTGDNLTLGSNTIYLYGTSVRRVKKNTPIAFVEPLLTGDSIESSMFNLNQTKTVFAVKCFIRNDKIDYDGFSKVGSIDAFMASTSVVILRWRDAAVTGYITSLNVLESLSTYQTLVDVDGLGDWQVVELTEVEFTLEVGVAI